MKQEIKSFSGIIIRENAEKKGIEIIFPEKPADNIIQKLKENGFQWQIQRGDEWTRLKK